MTTPEDPPPGAGAPEFPAPGGDSSAGFLRPALLGAGGWEIDDFLDQMRRSGRWSFYYFGEAAWPDAVAALRRWQLLAEVVVLWGMDRAAAWRAPDSADPLMPDSADPLMPDTVFWHYLGNARFTLRALLTLSWDGPFPPLYPAPPECRVPESQRRPYTFRPAQ